MKKVNPRIELIFLMRGFFATPLITGLAKKGLLDKFISLKKFKPNNFKEIKNQKFLLSILNYFTSLGLLEKKKNFFKVTNLGKKILGVGFLFAFSLKTPFSMLKCPKSAFFVIFGYFPIPFNIEFDKITKPVPQPMFP